MTGNQVLALPIRHSRFPGALIRKCLGQYLAMDRSLGGSTVAVKTRCHHMDVYMDLAQHFLGHV
jgi:hypothetical protein